MWRWKIPKERAGSLEHSSGTYSAGSMTGYFVCLNEEEK